MSTRKVQNCVFEKKNKKKIDMLPESAQMHIEKRKVEW